MMGEVHLANQIELLALVRLPPDWGECGQPHLLGILLVCQQIGVNVATLTCWGCFWITTRLR